MKAYASALEYTEKDEASYFVADLIGLVMLYFEQFDFEEATRKQFTEHHHSDAAKKRLLSAYEAFSRRIDTTYIPYLQGTFKNPLCFLKELIIPELQSYIVSFNGEDCKSQEINELAGVVFALCLISASPKLINDREKLIALGWLEE